MVVVAVCWLLMLLVPFFAAVVDVVLGTMAGAGAAVHMTLAVVAGLTRRGESESAAGVLCERCLLGRRFSGASGCKQRMQSQTEM